MLAIPTLLGGLLLAGGLRRKLRTLNEHRFRHRAGHAGEKRVAGILRHCGVEVLNDIMVDTAGGGTMQLDHAVRLQGGLLVIETKNWAAGNVRIDASGVTYKRGGPSINAVEQVNLSARRLEERLGIKVYRLVVLANAPSSTHSGHFLVVAAADLRKRIEELKGRRLSSVNEAPAWDTLRRIARTRATQKSLRRRHIAFLQKRHRNKREATGGFMLAAGAAVVALGVMAPDWVGTMAEVEMRELTGFSLPSQPSSFAAALGIGDMYVHPRTPAEGY